jgi:hypothetical protein
VPAQHALDPPDALAVQESTWLDRAHGVADGGAAQHGHGTVANVALPSTVREVQARMGGAGAAARLPARAAAGGSRLWAAQSVACGLDHMAAVISVDGDVLFEAIDRLRPSTAYARR